MTGLCSLTPDGSMLNFTRSDSGNDGILNERICVSERMKTNRIILYGVCLLYYRLPKCYTI